MRRARRSDNADGFAAALSPAAPADESSYSQLTSRLPLYGTFAGEFSSIRTGMLREIRDLFSYHHAATIRFAEHDVHNVFEKTLRDISLLGFSGLSGRRVLDLGCGQRYPFALQCSAAGAEVTALDINYIKSSSLPMTFYQTLRHNGFKRAIKSAMRQVMFDGRYYSALEITAGRPLRAYMSKIRFIVTDPAYPNYPLPPNFFDLIASNAVVEHVADVPQFAAEIERLLVPGGYFCAIIHNYYSLSGGHNLQWAFPNESPSTKVPPWDHLRENRYAAFAYLNRYRPGEYREVFAKNLQVLLFEGRDINHDPGGTEGESLLTKELEVELMNYSRDLLLTRAWCIICRKP